MTEGKREKALLVAVKLPEVSDDDFASSLAELSRLVSTLGYEAAGTVVQTRNTLAPAAVLGEGKLEELAALTDAVTIAAPTVAHYDAGKLLLGLRRHVLIEKPLTDNAEQAWELVALAKAFGLGNG